MRYQGWLGLGLALALSLGGVPFIDTSAHAQTQSTRMEDVRDQGVHYAKKGRFKQAYRTLKKAYKSKGGGSDFKTVYYLALSAHKMLILEDAFEMAELAVKLAGNKAKFKQRAEELLTELKSLFGQVAFKAAAGETNESGRIFFEAKTGILNKAKRERFMAIRKRFRSLDIRLPTEVYLPYGDYLANKVPFTIQEGRDAETLEIFLQKTVEEADNTWLWVGLGSATALAIGGTIGAVFLLEDPAPIFTQSYLPDEAVRNP